MDIFETFLNLAPQPLNYLHRTEKESSLAEQKKFIDEWMEDHTGEDEIRSKISQLRETQSQLERREDYDAAADIDQSILKLNEKCQSYKYEHPLKDKRVRFALHFID